MGTRKEGRFDKPMWAFVGAALLTAAMYLVIWSVFGPGSFLERPSAEGAGPVETTSDAGRSAAGQEVPTAQEGPAAQGTFTNDGGPAKSRNRIYDLFTQRGVTQYLSTWLFWSVVISLVFRWQRLRRENDALSRKIPKRRIDAQEARGIAEKMPPFYKVTLLGRRLIELLLAHGRGEELGELKGELARKDREELEQSYGLVDGLKYLILLSGFLGTVIGFSQQMASMGAGGAVNSLAEIQKALAAAAGHLGTAFETTLLALGYTVILLLVGHVLRDKEGKLLDGVDRKINSLVKHFVRKPTAASDRSSLMDQAADSFLEKFEQRMKSMTKEIIDSFQQELRTGLTSAVTGWFENWARKFSESAQELVDHVASQNGHVVKAIRDCALGVDDRLSHLQKSLDEANPNNYSIRFERRKGEDFDA